MTLETENKSKLKIIDTINDQIDDRECLMTICWRHSINWSKDHASAAARKATQSKTNTKFH